MDAPENLELDEESRLLAELLSRITPENLHAEVESGSSIGNEAW